MSLPPVLVVAGLLVIVALLRGKGDSTHSSDFLDTATEADMQALLSAGRRIDAITVYRRLHGVDLKAAKEAIELLVGQRRPR